MRIKCPCGNEVHDLPEQNPNAAHVIPDQDWFGLLDAIDAAIESPQATVAEREAACMKLRYHIGGIVSFALQCSQCGRLWILNRERHFQAFIPESESAKHILHSRHAA